jgi:hypothetical protein
MVINIPIHVNKIMNQKMDATTSQKNMSNSFIDAVRTARTRGSADRATIASTRLTGITRGG